VKRLKLFAKANVDVYDSLHSCKLAGRVVWNGVNEVMRDTGRGTVVRLAHETCTGSAALLEADGVVPGEVAARAHLMGSFPPASQFSAAVFETDADAIVLSVQPELDVDLCRHRERGYLFHPANAARWPEDDRAWLKREFTPPERVAVNDWPACFEQLIGRIRRHTGAPILVYNLSSVVPGERVHCYSGLEDALSTRIRRFNLGLIDLSERLGVSIVDVDAVLARAGADRLKLDATHLMPEGYRIVAEEVVRVLDDLGLVED
jgi:hypothetical protein